VERVQEVGEFHLAAAIRGRQDVKGEEEKKREREKERTG